MVRTPWLLIVVELRREGGTLRFEICDLCSVIYDLLDWVGQRAIPETSPRRDLVEIAGE